MKILVLCSDNPSPPINGTRIRHFHLWPTVREQGHEVKLLSLTRRVQDLKLSDDKIEFFAFTRKNIFLRIWMRFFHSYHEWPVSESLESRVHTLIADWKPDVIHADELRMGRYLPKRNEKNSNVLFSLCVHNVESELIKRTLASPFPFAKIFFNKIYQFTLKKFEKKIFSRSDIRFTYSEVDKNIYENLYPEFKFHVSSNGVNQIELSDTEVIVPSPKEVLFLGSLSYLPNMEGLFWFLDHVYPRIKDKVRLTVAGSSPAQEVKDRLNEHKITLHDTPLDLRPIYLSTSILLVPLLSGSGTRGKILEALMYSRAVLTTSIGVEGLHLGEGEGIIVADGAENYVKSIEAWVALNQDERQHLVNQGRSAVIKSYTWKSVGNELLKQWAEFKK